MDYKKLSLFLFLLVIAFLVIIIILGIRSYKYNAGIECTFCYRPVHNNVDLSEPEQPDVFHDLTTKEMHNINKYLQSMKDLDLDKLPVKALENNYRYLAELYLPKKSAVIKHLDNGDPQPAREAKVTLIMGKWNPPVVKEYIIGPLQKPSYLKSVHGKANNISFIFRPVGSYELSSAEKFLKRKINDELGDELLAHYNAKLLDCDRRNECLGFRYFAQMSPAVSGEFTRKQWFWLSRLSEYYLLNVLDFSVLLNTEKREYFIEKIWFQGETFDTIDQVKEKFRNGVNPYHSLTDEEQLFSSPRTRNTKKQPDIHEKFRAPFQVIPDGIRYQIKHRHVRYFDWSFHFRSSSAYGPQVYDIRFRNERIVYELGLQEMSVFYSANNPAQMFADFFDSSDLIGPKTTWLVPGVDCPVHASFIKTLHLMESSDDPVGLEQSFCIFEWNTGDPLRRHLSTYPYQEAFFEGLENIALVLRTSITVMNYDYIIDFRFFHNGVMQTRVLFTGFISTSFYDPEEDKYGYKLQKNIFGALHVHLINFKVDIDVKGTKNKFQTLNIKQHEVENIWSKKNNDIYHLIKFEKQLLKTEKEAAYKFDFDYPKYLLITANSTDGFQREKAYKIVVNGMTKQLLAKDQGNEPAASWARYQIAVTKHKDAERFSSCQYSAFDSTDPYIRFQDYIDDDDSIIDEDLVMWVTLGSHHIPKTEDLPVVTTAGMEVGLTLSPFNYFPEDPATESAESLRIEPVNGLDPNEGIRYNTEGIHSSCRSQSIQEILKKPEHIFEVES